MSTGSAQATAPGLAQTWGEVSDAAAAEIEMLFGTLDPRRLATFTEDGILEVFPGLGGLLRQVAALMPSGSLVNIDYGEWFSGPAAAGRSPANLGGASKTAGGAGGPSGAISSTSSCSTPSPGRAGRT